MIPMRNLVSELYFMRETLNLLQTDLFPFSGEEDEDDC